MTEKTELRWFLAVLAFGAALRLIGINYGLPAVFNADEPHVVSVAVSFGGGSLNPHFFRYPTLWMYILFGFYDLFFLLWSGFGLWHTVQQFGTLFVWNPTPFYLIARVLSAVFSLAALERVYRSAGFAWNKRVGLWAAAMLAVPYWIVASAHAAKPESLMLFLAAWAWGFALRYLDQGVERDLILCGLLTGLCAAAQYTAAPLGALVLTAWVLKRKGRVVLALAAVPAGFLIGCPFALLDYPAFFRMLRDLREMGGVSSRPAMNWWLVLRNVPTFSGAWLPGGAALLAGLGVLSRREPRRLILLGFPILAFWGVMAFLFDGAIVRYIFAVFPAVAMTAGVGVESILTWIERRGLPVRNSLATAFTLLVLMLPGATVSIAFDRELLLPDTRTIAARWIEAHIPEGTKILMDQEHASPRLRPSREIVEKMAEQTKASGHPRYKYYELMLAGHPGGGYTIYQIFRDPTDLRALPGHAAFSAQGRPVLDVRPGLEVAKKAGIQVVVLTSHGAELYRSPEVALFLRETEQQGSLLAGFDPAPGERTGPRIRVFRIQ